jgi:hypothetical protein
MAVTKTALADLSGSYLFTDTDNAATIVSANGASTVIYSIDVDNTANAAVTYTKLYNVASGSVTVGTTAPNMVVMVPASTRLCIQIPQGVTFDTAVSVASVTTAGTAGSTGPTSDVIVRMVIV